MVKKLTRLIIILVIAGVKNHSFANPNNGFPYLSLSLNAAEMGCGEIAGSSKNFLVNPAGLPETENYVFLSHYSLTSNADIGTSAVEYFNYRHRKNFSGQPLILGIDFLFQHEDPIPQYDEWNFYLGDIIIQNFSLGLNLVRPVNPAVNLGLTWRYFLKRFVVPSYGTTTGQSIGIDLGAAGIWYRTHWMIAYQNLGPKIAYDPPEDRNDDLPRQLRAGLSKNIWQTNSEALEIFSDIVWADADVPRLRFGTQYSWQNSFFLRLGYLNKESSGGSIAGLSGGFGIRIKNIAVDIASGAATAIGAPMLVTLSGAW